MDFTINRVKNAMFVMVAIVLGAALASPADAQSGSSAEAVGAVQFIVCMQGVLGGGVGPEFPGCFRAESLGLAVGREMQSSGEKGGTEDINIGVGELSPVTVQKPTDGTSALLFAFGVNGNSFGDAEIFVREQRAGWSEPLTTLEVRLGRAFVQSLQIDPATRLERVELHFNKIQLTSFERDANGAIVSSTEHCWDRTKNKPCSW